MARAMVEDDDERDQEIREQVNEWSSIGTECLNIELVQSNGQVVESFQPTYTYAMFGEEEAIFGYQGLDITLSFAAHDLKPRLKIKYDDIFKAQGEVRPTDIREALQDFLPKSAFAEGDDENDFAVPEGWTPPGNMIHAYTRDEKSYQIWCASLSDPAARTILENMQILIPFFIDGGSALELEQEWTTARWQIFLLYEVDAEPETSDSPYILAGYGTSYRNFAFLGRATTAQTPGQADPYDTTTQTLADLLPQASEAENKFAQTPKPSSPLYLPSRERLSQFLILPPHQSAGHGQELYNTMYNHLTAPDYVQELTIEDPNEDFDQLRDVCDLLRLRRDPAFRALRIHTQAIPAAQLAMDARVPTDLIVPLAVRQATNALHKIQPRQFDRLVEMQTLAAIPPLHRSKNRITRKERAANSHDREYFFWRLYAKQRLYLFNQDQLAQIDAAERVEKLDAALDGVIEGYLETLERVERIEKERPAAAAGPSSLSGQKSVAAKRKRRAVLEEDEDADDDTEGPVKQLKKVQV